MEMHRKPFFQRYVLLHTWVGGRFTVPFQRIVDRDPHCPRWSVAIFEDSQVLQQLQESF